MVYGLVELPSSVERRFTSVNPSVESLSTIIASARRNDATAFLRTAGSPSRAAAWSAFTTSGVPKSPSFRAAAERTIALSSSRAHNKGAFTGHLGICQMR